MAKKVRVVVDSNDIFYEGLHDAATKQRVMKSALWPVAIALYSHCERDIRIGPVHYTNDEQYNYHFLTPSGFTVAALTYHTGTVQVMSADTPMTTNKPEWVNSYSTRLSTSNIRYAVSKFAPSSSHDMKGYLSTALTSARTAMNEVMRDSLLNIIRKMSDGRSGRPSIAIDNHIATSLVCIVAGGEDRSIVPQNHLNEIDALYKNYVKQVEQFKATIDKTKTMFSGDKWVVIPNMLGGVLVGAITPQPMLAGCDLYMRDGSLPGVTSFSYLDRVVPFKWYKDYEAISEDIRRELDLSLLMLKTHTNSPERYPTTQAYFEVWESIEAFTVQDYNTGNTRVFVLSK